ncbi:hypothetical protein Pmar_PMAR019998 [Perkinsus marinus ATCC 50983]|uniref:Uncharacterized protein n=1 Tax=Perkinsus marinus (strain ATCC 50983 / TXsc) TaxID=423536 RepID=C5LJA4_PERM5|nr:hypothetical protein Pmar_PMAR019998 [Perkinsus marinus ATCC 50983]EER03220.1 hypothetical protein Pmar_PMAR019998 [Perkinsus marinus ATCC 50983]|eukprot:XP_002771404.1 hypothetical protein Pmar_PMAR019998 [Perkinsus marinus ATCC 50983]
MSAFSREYISTADAEPLVLAAMDDTTAVRVVKADVAQHGLVEGLREIIRLQSPSYQPGMVYGVVVELQPTSDTKLSELDAADEYMSVLFSCSQSRHEQPVHNEVWVVATGEKEWQWESDEGWPRGMDRYLAAPTVTAGAFTLTQTDPYGFELTAAVPGAGLKTLRSSTEEATIKALLKEKHCYVGLRSDEGFEALSMVTNKCWRLLLRKPAPAGGGGGNIQS